MRVSCLILIFLFVLSVPLMCWAEFDSKGGMATTKPISDGTGLLSNAANVYANASRDTTNDNFAIWIEGACMPIIVKKGSRHRSSKNYPVNHYRFKGQ
jgi:hypothetical protein